jgi:two-component system LytT family response regulator
MADIDNGWSTHSPSAAASPLMARNRPSMPRAGAFVESRFDPGADSAYGSCRPNEPIGELDLEKLRRGRVMTARLRIVIADDERPARSFLASALRAFDDVVVVGEATSGREAVDMIERTRPDLALLDLHMPELDGMGVVRLVKRTALPLVAFVTAFDEYAIRAFEMNAVDYLLKPVDGVRLRETINRAQERLERAEVIAEQRIRVGNAICEYEVSATPPILERIPVRSDGEIVIVPVARIASIVAEGELLHLTTTKNERHSINYRLKDLESRLDPNQFVRLSRGTLANVECISRISLIGGGTYMARLSNGQKLPISRLQSRIIRERLLKL